jgi:hypothetical protein
VKRFEFAAGAKVSLFLAMWLRDIFKHGSKPCADSPIQCKRPVLTVCTNVSSRR